jgi:hypothetical protein
MWQTFAAFSGGKVALGSSRPGHVSTGNHALLEPSDVEAPDQMMNESLILSLFVARRVLAKQPVMQSVARRLQGMEFVQARLRKNACLRRLFVLRFARRTRARISTSM